ncbi:MAG: hypothetical protein K940chlam5_00747 [Candidatus Anoxychlamydiales bacterium]|uniref:Uncharacterized protein n=1 Tax=marine sediment metagenome TaxID=412755 RepID=A0A0F9MCW3_9ZZZZ|nr:hypothetical protein [Candidatus Anoxychlamydiales bacterium]
MNLKKILLLTSLLLISISFLGIKLVKADGATIVGYDMEENSDYKIEMTVYKYDDDSEDLDFYLVKIWTNDKYNSYYYSRQFVKIFAYTPTAEIRESERRPIPATYTYYSSATITYHGITIHYVIVRGTLTTSYWHSSGATQSYSWTYTTTWLNEIDREMTYTLGYVVEEGRGLTVGAYTTGTWKNLFWWTVHTGSSPSVTVSV